MTELRLAFAVFVSLSAFAFLACSPSIQHPEDPKPSPNGDAGAPLSFDECGLACWRVRLVGCSEGKPVACEETCLVLLDDGMPLPFVCLSSATTVDAVRACGLRCIP